MVGQKDDDIKAAFLVQELRDEGDDFVANVRAEGLTQTQATKFLTAIVQWATRMATFTNFERSIAVLGSTGSGSTSSSKRRAATLVDAGEVFPGKDVALIKVAARNMATVPLGDDTALGAGDRLFVLGFPGAATFNPTLSKASQGEPTLTQGVLSAKEGVNGGYTVLQTDAGMTHGNSGGPVLDEQGKVVGHVVAEVRVPDGLALTVPAVGGGSVWALALDTEVSAMLDPRVSLARIDPASNRVTARIPVPGTGLGGVVAMAYGAGSVWLVDSDQASHDVGDCCVGWEGVQAARLSA